MKTYIKKATSLTLAFAVALSLCIFPVHAASELTGEVSNNMPLGTLTESELQQLRDETSGYCTSCPSPRHWGAGLYHIHEIMDMIRTYYHNMPVFPNPSGLAIEAPPSTAPQTIGISEEVTVSNSWSASMAFSEDVISAEVGFNVEYSRSAIASYTLSLEAGQGGRIYYWHRYEIDEFTLKTTYYNPYSPTPLVEYGTGDAWQWLSFYSYGEVYT